MGRSTDWPPRASSPLLDRRVAHSDATTGGRWRSCAASSGSCAASGEWVTDAIHVLTR
jgi:hypothetical protein